MICNVISQLHHTLLSQTMHWCSSYETMVLTVWLCVVLIVYVTIVYLIKILRTFNVKKEKNPLESLCKAIEENDVVNCVRLLEVYPQYINRYTSSGYTPFLIACLNGNTQIVKLMLRKGADVRLKSTKKESPVYLATFYYIKCPHFKNATCIRELYYAGADINDPNDKGLTPLQMAAMFGHTGLVKWLLTKNASTSIFPDPYLIACSQGHQETARTIWRYTLGFSLKYK